MTSKIVNAPVVNGAETRKIKDKTSGKTYYRKQILPEGKYNYKGTELDLTAPQLQTFVKSFKDGAFDEVPFQFGGTESEHNNDPLRRGGTLAGMEHVPGKGLIGYFDFSTSPEAQQYVEKYPRFGVSPRIELGIERADGKTFAGAIQHVCGTVVPRVNGMGAWDKVELSEAEDAKETIDLSTETIEVAQEAIVAPEVDEKVTLTPDEVTAFRKWVAEQKAIEDEIKARETPAVDPNIVMANDYAKQALDTTRALQADLARSRWETESAKLVRDGVPPSAIELATPVMEKPSTTIDLSSGGVDPQDTVRALLEGLKGTVNLSGAVGHEVGGHEPDETQEEIAEFEKSFRNDFNLY